MKNTIVNNIASTAKKGATKSVNFVADNNKELMVGGVATVAGAYATAAVAVATKSAAVMTGAAVLYYTGLAVGVLGVAGYVHKHTNK